MFSLFLITEISQTKLSAEIYRLLRFDCANEEIIKTKAGVFEPIKMPKTKNADKYLAR